MKFKSSLFLAIFIILILGASYKCQGAWITQDNSEKNEDFAKENNIKIEDYPYYIVTKYDTDSIAVHYI